jgi:hypothetical protein
MSQWQTLAALQAVTAFGYCYVSSPAGTTVTSGGTYYLVAGTFAAGTLDQFTHNGSGRLTYTGTTTRLFSVDVSISMTSTNNIITHWRVAKNGTTIANSEQKRKVSTGSDVGNSSVHAEVELAANDYVEVFCTSDIGQDVISITADFMTITVS